MKKSGPATKFAVALGAASMLFSTAASAAPAVRAADYVVSASLISASSQAAVCATGAASAAAAGAAVAAQAAQPGCVLPVTDAAPAPVVETPPPAVYVPPAEGGGLGIGTLPLLLGLAAVAGLAWLLLDNDDDDDEAISPG